MFLKKIFPIGTFFLILILIISPNYVFAQRAPPFPLPTTYLMVTLNIEGPYANPGDQFTAICRVKNIGTFMAVDVCIDLKNIPSDWRVMPRPPVSIGTIMPGKERETRFRIIRGETDSTIYAEAWAKNTPKATSNSIPIPEYPLAILFVASLGFLGYFLYKRKSSKEKLKGD